MTAEIMSRAEQERDDLRARVTVLEMVLSDLLALLDAARVGHVMADLDMPHEHRLLDRTSAAKLAHIRARFGYLVSDENTHIDTPARPVMRFRDAIAPYTTTTGAAE